MSFLTVGAISAGIAGVSALGKVAHGIMQNHQASEIEKNNLRPTMGVQDGYKDNVALADQMSRVGTPSAQYNLALQNINRNQAAGLQALGNSANPSANIASLIRAGNDATGQLDAQSAVTRNHNLLNLMQQRQALAQQQQQAWNYNYADKYSEGLAKSQALRGAGTQNITGGINDVGQIGQSMLMGGFGSVGSSASAGAINNVLPGATISPGYFNPNNGNPSNLVGTNWFSPYQHNSGINGPYLQQ